jgi:DNA-binding CsgD family transcriptional regulator
MSPASNRGASVRAAHRSLLAATRQLGIDPVAGYAGDTEATLHELDRVEGFLHAAAGSAAPFSADLHDIADGEPAGSWHDLVTDVRSARTGLLAHELTRQRSMMTDVTMALARLRAATTVDDLVESIPIQTVALGYERAMFSWVDDEYWVPRSMFTMSGPAEAQAILAAGAPPYVHTRELLEVEVVRFRRSILVLDCDSNPRVHPHITPVSRSTTYVAAPIVARNHVAAFVHMDRNVDSGANDEFDRQLLGLFCEGIGVMLDHLLLAQDHADAASIDDQHPVADWIEVLTDREREVLRLMAQGLTNPQIANRLFISAETTKTHVKKLMRKLGVHTRAEAGAMYHQLRAPRPPRVV